MHHLKHRGWPKSSFLRERSSDRTQPIVSNARFFVRCVCGYAHDSAAETAEAAIAEIRARHNPACVDYTATAYVCKGACCRKPVTSS